MELDEVRRVAREAGAERNSDYPDWSFDDGQLERFANEVERRTLEKAAKLLSDATGTGRIIGCTSAAAAIRSMKP